MKIVPFYRRRGFKIAVVFLGFALLYYWLLRSSGFVDSGWQGAIKTVAFDLILGAAVLTIMLGLISQFVLPVQTGRERRGVIGRLLSHIAGERGPVMFLRNGETVESQHERKRKGAGVVLIDFASAAVFRTDTQFTRAMGPGLVFTQRGEWLAEPIDLRQQLRSIEGDSPARIEDSERELIGTMAITQDGIPLSSDLTIEFMLNPGHANEPRKGHFANLPPYEYYRDSVERAVYLHTYTELEDFPWTEIPLMLLIDLWREHIKDRRLDDLIGRGRIPADELRKLERSLFKRLTEPTMHTKQGDGNAIEEQSLEFHLLKDRGIRVLDVKISKIFLPSNIREERLRVWREEWAGEIQASLANSEQEIRRTKQRAVINTSKMFAEKITNDLQGRLEEEAQIDWTETLAYLLRGTIKVSQDQRIIQDELQLAQALRRIQEQIAGSEPGSSHEVGTS